MKTQQFRQGDVLVQRVTSIPEGDTAVARDNGRVVLAYGEVTGHAHAIAEAEVTNAGRFTVKRSTVTNRW
jgi:hypothetical protein